MTDFGAIFGAVLAANALILTIVYVVVFYRRGESVLHIFVTLFLSIPVVLFHSLRVWAAVSLVAFLIIVLNDLLPGIFG